MKIKTRLTLNYVILTAGILLFFSVAVLLFYIRHRQQDFIIRLNNKAINTATLLINVKDVDERLLKTIDDSTVTNMNKVLVIVLNHNKRLLYCNKGKSTGKKSIEQFKDMNWETNDHLFINEKLFMSLKHIYQKRNYYVLATAEDYYSRMELKKLLYILSGVFIFSILLIIIAGYINASQALSPITTLIKKVDSIEVKNLSKRLAIRNNDEIDELAKTFNKMLTRIEKAFESERMFISNASHELRTPVTSIKGQLEVALINARSEEEYKIILSSILEDVQNMIPVINGFLDLAEANIEPDKVTMHPVRIDEVIFYVKDNLVKTRPEYKIFVEFENTPDDEKDVMIKGNLRLLSIMMSNLIDNACKFSDNHKTIVKLSHDEDRIIINIIDNGIGIPEADLINIYRPLYRAANAKNKFGHGLGLSIVERIAAIHDSEISISTEVNVGTNVRLIFKKFNTSIQHEK